MSEMLKVSEVARILNVNPRTVYFMIQRGELKASRIGRGSYRVAKQDLENMIEGRK